MFSRIVPAEDFPAFRRRILRNGGAIVMSSPCLDGTRVAGAYRVTYVSTVGAL